jgi:DNA-binding IclR family transcriptional regulator
MSQATIERNTSGRPTPDFAFLTNHGKTLLLIAHDLRIRMRDIADLLGITERATQRIVADLARAGYLARQRDGRRNLYSLSPDLPLGLPTQRDIDIRALLALLPARDERAPTAAP